MVQLHVFNSFSKIRRKEDRRKGEQQQQQKSKETNRHATQEKITSLVLSLVLSSNSL